MALAERVFLADKYGRSWMCLLIMFVSSTLDVGVTQHQRQRSINNVSRVIEDLLETYDIRLRPRFGGRRHAGRKHLILACLLTYLPIVGELMRIRIADKNELKLTAYLNRVALVFVFSLS